MADDLMPARLVTPWDIIARECMARGEAFPDEMRERAETGRLTKEDCLYLAGRFGTSYALWHGLNAEAARWIAEHPEATHGD